MSAYTDEQSSFFFDLCKLGLWLKEQGYEVSEGEGWRPPWVAEVYAKQGKGSKLSLHIDRLAHDLIIRKNGVEVGPEDYKRAGAAWKALNEKNAWGGDFTGNVAGDFQHFSRSFGGRK